MQKATTGSIVKVHYTGKLSDGTVFDSSENREPLEFRVGDGHIIKGFENAIEGMSVGEKKTINISADEAYGPHRNDLIVRIERSQIPLDITPAIGMNLQIKQPNGVINVVIADMDESSITLDANHPLAGKDLTFDIELVEVA
ncbi:peptidyl-prolyl cis-trans isomerase [Dissulfurispira thermophila]|uniref:Peptidyl-prolyl cis-trans isomerase n=2 Tax=root TaxID=1 RepID=A0A7G1GZF2_9BACT|nr:peptidylprolyl isomerase [Dissulfurispira thermophila]BCB95303.1 peptidyl-prolyl cis-trans isomerase [Dissulfurispira thermophila]